MRRQDSSIPKQVVDPLPHEILFRRTGLEDLIHIADGIRNIRAVDLGHQLSPGMRRIADCLFSLDDVNMPFSVAHRDLADTYEEALEKGLHLVAGRATGSSTLFLAFAPFSLRACIVEVSGRTS
jgi:hypothetical protein